LSPTQRQRDAAKLPLPEGFGRKAVQTIGTLD